MSGADPGLFGSEARNGWHRPTPRRRPSTPAVDPKYADDEPPEWVRHPEAYR